VNRRAPSRVSHPNRPGPADQVTDQIADGLQRLAVVLVHVPGAEPEPDLIVDRPQVKQHISPLRPIHAASLRTLRQAGYDRRDPSAVLITMPGSHPNDRTRHSFYNAGMSEPAANPGSDADILYGMDRALTLEETGLDSAFPLPGRTAERYGQRSGIYLSVYEYPSSGRDSTLTSKHYVMAVQRGAKLAIRSVPAPGSQLAMDLSANGRILTGTWAEQTCRDAFAGAVKMRTAAGLRGSPAGPEPGASQASPRLARHLRTCG
jgi:hypothetical protein